MPKYTIIQEREKCIGCGSCAAVCPGNWEIKDDGKASPIKTEVEEIGCNKQAEEVCPAQCIHVKMLKLE